MAQKDLTLRIKTVETQLNKSLKKIEKLEGIINKLSSKKVKLNTSPAQRAVEKLKKEVQKGTKIVDKLFDSSRSSGFGNSIAKVNSQLSLVTKSFNAANSAADRQERATSLIAGNLKKMRMEAAAFAGASGQREALKGGAGNVGIRLKEIREFPRTILAGNQAMNILNGMLELAEVNSKEFLQINKAIGEQLKINASIQEAADKASGVTDKKNRNKNNQRTAQRVKAIKEQTLNIERRIQDSTLNQTTKNQLINNLKRSGVQLDKRELELAKQINIETQRNLTMEEKMQRRRGRIAQSALIGGGFPLLFGGGILQAGAGALGGGIGEAISPGGGFAGSIAATALIGSIQKFSDSAREVGNALKDANLGLEKLEELGFAVDESTKKQVASLLELGKAREAEALVTQKFAELIGSKGVKNLQDLDTAFDELQRETSKLFLQISSELAPAFVVILNLVKGIVQQINSAAIQRAAFNLDPTAFRNAQAQANQQASAFGNTPILKNIPIINTAFGNRELQQKILTKLSEDIIDKNSPDLTTGLTKTDQLSQKSAKAEESKLEALVEQTLQYDAIVMFGTKEAEIRKQIKEFEEAATGEELKQIATGKINVRQLIEQNNEAKKLADNVAIIEDSFERLANTITQDIGNGIKGLIKGTQSLNDVLRNVTNKIADAFLNMAIFGNFGGGSVTGGLLGAIGFANGGRPPVGKASIVGERGAELFVPDRPGTIIPNHQLGSMGNTNIVVNVDASGSSVEGDETQGRELGRLISVAVQSEIIQQQRPGGLLA